uniref:HECT-type E3 ubiquitin transferase n=1 Tax=Meleagris gallopavo TaxID=9103 RepID=A0A803YDA7_MELGA
MGWGAHGDRWGRGTVGGDDTRTRAVTSTHSFNQLDLPAYESYEKLRQMLLLAIQECSEGFGLA